MSAPWTFAGEPPSGEDHGAVTLLEGSTFCISDAVGDIVPDRTQGLFVRDTRVVSRWELSVDTVTPTLLSVQRGDPYAATFISRVPPRAGLADSTALIVRRRYVGDGMREDLTLRNTAEAPLACALLLRVEGDFADLFEVKEGRPQHSAGLLARVEDGVLVISRHRFDHEQGIAISGDGDPDVTLHGLRWDVALTGRGEWTVSVEATPVLDGVRLPIRHPRGRPLEHTVPARRLQEWRQYRPVVQTGHAGLAATLQRSVEDLGALRIYDPAHPERAVVAAGAPWFMALFGRDSLLTAWMLLPLDTGLAVGTLQTLADHQGVRHDPVTEEQPGRILHEIRLGPATHSQFGERRVYYGTADATPLFVMLLGELARWSGLTDTVASLVPYADRALEWILEHGDIDGDAFVEYERASESGLANQGWKDSWDGVNFADGRVAEAPIALAEVQGYCYAAFAARAELATHLGDASAAALWSRRAAELKDRFNEQFWLPNRGWFATGLDGDKRPIDALTSNLGHCLWTGIIDADKARAVADRLVSQQMFSGWGVRTLSSEMGAYNPMSYHNGSVWPHDTALCASGLMRYGFVEHAQRVTAALIDAATHFGHRLPELFCGFGRDEFAAPVPYPASCSPQAWAAAAPISLLRTILRLDPDVPGGRLACEPAVPREYLPLRMSGVPVGSSVLTIDVGETSAQVLGLDGVQLVGHAPT